MKTIMMVVLVVCLLAITGYAYSFHLVVLNTSEQPVQTLYRLNTLLQNQPFAENAIVFSTGGLFPTHPFHLYANIFDTADPNALGRLLRFSGAAFYAPTLADWAHGFSHIQTALSIPIPIVVSDAIHSDTLSHWTQSIHGKQILFINILSQESADWYDVLRTNVDINRMDLILIMMDEPSLRMVPENLRSKTVAISRKTALYRADLEFGLLVTEVTMNEPPTPIPEMEGVLERVSIWERESFSLDPLQHGFFKEISFYSNLALMLRQIQDSDGILFHHEPLPKKITPSDAISFFANYVIGMVEIPGSDLRRRLEASASVFNYDGVHIRVDDHHQFFSYSGEPYYIDLTRDKGNRLIMKSFTNRLKLLVFGERSRLIADFPGVRILPQNAIYYAFWSIKAYHPLIRPSWHATIMPYYRHYIVEQGDTLNSIARDLGISVDSIRRLNPGIIERYLLPGTVLTVHIPYHTETKRESEVF